jgi:membrane fusion protein (multidrug efflux system)
MKNIIQIIAVIALMICAGCGDSEGDKKVVPPVATTYKIMTLQPARMSANVQLPGVMQPYQFVQLFPKINGFVKNVNVDRGSAVRKGQLLITLEAPETEQLVAAAKLRYTQAQANYITSKDRYRRVKETSLTPGAISPYDLEAAASKMQGDSATAQGEYANFRAQQSLQGYLTVTAPFDGIITERNVHPGALAGPGAQNTKPMLILQQVSKLRLVVDLPEQYAAQIKTGDKIHYKINSLPGQVYEGLVSRESKSLNSSFRSETIEIDVENKSDLFKPGMYAEVILPTSGNANAFVVPKSAIVNTTERKYVVLVDNNIARWIDVTEGNQSGDSTEVFGKINNGDQLIINANYHILEGKVVK